MKSALRELSHVIGNEWPTSMCADGRKTDGESRKGLSEFRPKKRERANDVNSSSRSVPSEKSASLQLGDGMMQQVRGAEDKEVRD